MMNGTLQTIKLDSQSVNKAIEVLANAAKDFNLTPRERLSYWGLMRSADLAIAHFVITFSVIFVSASFFPLPIMESGEVGSASDWKMMVIVLIFLLSPLTLFLTFLVGIPSLLFSISLLRKTIREQRKLRALGVTELSKSLWKVNRRSLWWSRLRGALVVFIGIYMIAGAIITPFLVHKLALFNDEFEFYTTMIIVAVAIWLAIMLFTARYLRNQREQMELAANAERLRSILQKMLQQAGEAGTIAVPIELIEQIARIESVQIAQVRNTAIRQNAGSYSSGYAIMFEDGAVRQRSMLNIEDRIELQDLEAELSTEDVQPVPAVESLPQQPYEQILRSLTKSKRIEIEYVMDRDARIIRITAVRPLGVEVTCIPIGENRG